MATDASTSVFVEISYGELIDKITILEIKRQQIVDPAKLGHVTEELARLLTARDGALTPSPRLTELTQQLRAVNEELWDVEDALRVCEQQRQFDARFVRLARNVYFANDRRAELKRQINDLLGSTLVEEKQYVDYRR